MATATARAADLHVCLGDLVDALTALGDAASAAALAHSDVRLHVVACQAHHEAQQLLGATSPAPTYRASRAADTVRDAASRLRAALDRQHLTPTNISGIVWLLQLAEGVDR